ncbi:hypothetical protein HN51_038485 [Arachis hypogaea]
MYGYQPHYHRGGAGNRPRQPAPQQPQNAAVGFQNPNPFPPYGSHRPNTNGSPAWLGITPQQLPQTQNPNFPIQNAIGFAPQWPQTPNPKQAIIEQLDRAAATACRDFLAAGEYVSAWNVSQKALLALQVDSWNTLGIKMQQVPSLHRLMITEGKVNAFVHCFVGVRRITSMYDLKMAICRNEGVAEFEALGLGPFLRQPLVMHYFSVSPEATEVFEITSGEIVKFLSEFLDVSGSKEIKAEEFLDFIAKKRLVKCREWLGIRIHNLGMHIAAIREARNFEESTLEKCLKTLKVKREKIRKHPISSSQKKQLDERFSAIAQRVESFSSVEKSFRGKHIRFTSSSSEDEDCDYSTEDDQNQDNDIIKSSCSISTSQFGKSSERVSTCPYPSATEEMERLRVRCDPQAQLHLDSSQKQELGGPPRKKQKSENATSKSAPSKLLKKEKIESDANRIKNGTTAKVATDTSEDLSMDNDSLRMFVTTWKEACREHNVAEVLERMLRFYEVKPRRRNKVRMMFSSYPFIGLLNAAVSSIKSGTWNSIYDTLQAIGHDDLTNSLTTSSEYETIDIGPSLDYVPLPTKDSAKNTQRVSDEDVIRKISTYFDFDNEVYRNCNSPLERGFMLLRKFYKCEDWVSEQFGVKNFNSLGYGDFLSFVEKYVHHLPHELLKLLVGSTCGKSSLEACMSSNQLAFLVSQALSGLWDKEKITKKMISMLLIRQFPSVNFDVMENGALEDFLGSIGEQKSSVTSKCVLFSAAIIQKYHFEDSLRDGDNLCKISTDNLQMIQKTSSETVIAKKAIEVLLKAPMLSDLSKWSHWDFVFAPFLGSLTSWLLNDVNSKELLCLVTKDGKVIRLDQLATLDSFLEAAVQGSSFQTAVNLLSLVSLVGGEKYAPLSLLKCHAQRAFEVMFRNSIENIEVSNGNVLQSDGAVCKMKMLSEISTTKMTSEFNKQMHKLSSVMSTLSRFILKCLGFLPAEFHSFAADVLLSGMQSVSKDAASAILCECINMEQRLMLHEVGFSLGITEWINDYNSLISNDASDLSCAGSSCIKDAKTEKSTGLKHDQAIVDKTSVPQAEVASSPQAGGFNERGENSNVQSIGCPEDAFQHVEDTDAALVIESIRRDEFGLEPSLSDVENCMLQKQHARLGRALHCLSQELYSQDSHFILELVQNADDNTYPDNVEPTLTFILQDSRIVILNNERGFSAQNMRALCDVGNSTKKGSNAGYIGKKGIGFKSVFRVTDAPEIHSNGFHVKFDISEGQIGFVLPTVVPPCDTCLLSRMASTDTDSCDDKHWNTCIVLPLKSHLPEGSVVNSIMTMFSDIHPSLLLFLHRLKCIKLRNLLNDTLIVMKKEISEDGIIKVSHGKEKMAWFVVSEKLQTKSFRFDVKTTEISMAFTLQESDDGYSPCLDQQPVFAYLPLRTYGLKFILQGDFVLPSSREEVDGDSPWNQWLLSEYPSLFVRALREFCMLPCFRNEPGKGLSAFMSFVPLVGEVHGFFSSLPRQIISKLRLMSCLLVEGDLNQWSPPCKVLRGWTEQVRNLLPDNILLEHLGLRYLDKNTVLSDTLARALGIEEFGPNILIRVLSSLCHTKSGMISMGMSWLASCLNTLYVTIFNSSGSMSANSEIREDILQCLQKLPFIPLSDGTYSSVDEGTIWLQSNTSSISFNSKHNLEAFPNICAKLRTVNPTLFPTSSADTSSLNATILDNVTRLLQSIGVQQLSVHDVVKLHILPALSDETMANKNKVLMVEYLCFVMLHLTTTCSDCVIEKEHIISVLRGKSLLLTNCGFKCPAEVPIHFCAGLGNPVSPKKLADFVNMRWHEIDISYLKHPVNESFSSAGMKWREFFEKIGVTDFAQVVQVDKSVADVSDTTFKHAMWDRGLISPDSRVIDWESPEIQHLVSLLSKSGNQENCKYLLEVLDRLWDACYADKTIGYFSNSDGDRYPFKSAFLCKLCDVQWVASSMDGELHYAKDLFYDCESVRMILGAFAPYASPKVKSERLVNDLGFKTRVTLGDILDILKAWRKNLPNSPFKASIRQMSKLYSFVWNEMAASKQKTMENLMSGPFIFVPYSSVSSDDDVVCGTFLYPNEVYWHDSTGSVQEMKEFHPQCSSSLSPINKSLCTIYPGLRGFFVEECGVQESPPLRSYIQILLQLSTATLPSQAADKTFQVFLKWADGLRSGLLSLEDVIYLKDCLSKLEFPVLPTVQDKWVSLHPSFGLVCWSDDKKLKKEFKHSDNIDFLYFGELTKDDKEQVQNKISNLMKNLGIPAISEVVNREAIYYGLADCSLKESLINWILPYAQRYILKLHSARYAQLKQSNFDIVMRLKIIVVEKLFYRNVIKSCGSASTNRVECSCLLQENVLYTTQESDYHSLFMELSSLLFDGTSELHFANFLHMITTMAESGSSKEQIEFFIVNSQKVHKLPDEEPVWELSSVSTLEEAGKVLPLDQAPSVNGQLFTRRKAGVNKNWPPADWKTAPDFNYARANGLKTQAPGISNFTEATKDDNSESTTDRPVCAEQPSLSFDWTIKDDQPANSVALVLHENNNLEGQSYHDFDPSAFAVHTGSDPVCLDEPLDEVNTNSSSVFSRRDRLQYGAFDAVQAKATGRLGELLACKYFVEKVGKDAVKWVNEVKETGYPYDIVIGEESNIEYIEVKATRSPRKDWFNITTNEWQFAFDKGESFSIAFVAIMENNVAKVTIFKNPVKLCHIGQLQLAVMMPRQQKQLPPSCHS